ncbi:hypothetical protein CPG37_04300 [Malaciobacter canalis]|uniref:Oligosaccharide repeat unit polymerase n=1 Tax=Malaciobacter canalis TaxID=1912871 RepID=A0ABX4LRB1_9BACT|nr:O-antigen polymerase [Malaciobacter canalis]PHO10273.1 hypothetical protein CPG37_04300 [Malaciobacter canalis]QEE32377.1 oligosaccharide repeat unit polymerase [Malaciobacter canalis]
MYKIYIYPFFSFLFIWVFFLLFRSLPIINWPELNEKTIFFLFSSLFVMFTFYFITAIYCSTKTKIIYQYNMNFLNINKIYRFLLIVSLFSLFLIGLNMIIQLKAYNLGLNLNSLTLLRYMKMENNLFNGSFLYQLTLIFTGFPLIFYLFSMYYKTHLSKRKKQSSTIVLIFFLILSLSSGGRNTLFLSLIILGLAFLYKNKVELKKNLIKWKYLFIFIFFSIVSLLVFGKMFLDREKLRGRTIEDGINNILIGYDLKLHDFFATVISIDILKEINYTFFMLYFYAVHSLNQLDNFIINSLLNQDLYYGAMSFYPIIQFLNKFGLDLPTIAMIKSEINDTGTYKTLLGSLYFDFGIIGTSFVLGILSTIFVISFSKFYFKKSFLGFCLAVILSMVFVTSPIYNTFSTGMIFLPFIISMFVLYVFMKFNRI